MPRILAQLSITLAAGLALKYQYSTASVDDLRWILAPTAFLVELITRIDFSFESYAGYMSADKTFLIAASCSGVNFLIISFLVLMLGKMWREGGKRVAWRFIPIAFLVAYFTALIANTTRIIVALATQNIDTGLDWLDREQLHRIEGIVVYFGSLVLLFLAAERLDRREKRVPIDAGTIVRRSICPLAIYYAVALGIPFALGAYVDRDFWEHSVPVILIPLLLLIAVAAFINLKDRIGINLS